VRLSQFGISGVSRREIILRAFDYVKLASRLAPKLCKRNLKATNLTRIARDKSSNSIQ
jgi:hypothetical protein